jgi:hypothetical protein
MFYRIAYFNIGKELFPEKTSGGLISLFISFNIITLIEFVIEMKLSWEILVILGLIIYIISSKYIFTEDKFDELCIIWENETKKQIYLKTSFMVIYFAVTIFLFLFITIQYPEKLTLFNK